MISWLRMLPPAAVQPIIGGTAPVTAPIRTANEVIFFSGVYNALYQMTLNIPKSAVIGVVKKYNMADPADNITMAIMIAVRDLSCPAGKGRSFVLVINAS